MTESMRGAHHDHVILDELADFQPTRPLRQAQGRGGGIVSDPNEREYYLCDTCSYGVSGIAYSSSLLALVDAHEAITGHIMTQED